MNISLWYDPVLPATHIKINKQWIDDTDIYGVLYPVRNFPIQTWLAPTGSWAGIAKRLAEIARGEKTEIHFHGRSIDYSDLQNALSVTEYVLSFHEWDAITLWESRLQNALHVFRNTLSQQKMEESDPYDGSPHQIDLLPEIAERIKALENSQYSSDWLNQIDGSEGYLRALRNKQTCCKVSSSFLSSFSQLNQLPQLNRSMHRCADMICCVLDNESKAELFRQYAFEFPSMAFHFCSQKQWLDERESLFAKYGLPYEMRRRIGIFRAIATDIQALSQNSEALNDELMRLQSSISSGNSEAELLQKELRLRKQAYWINIERGEMEHLQAELLDIFDSQEETERDTDKEAMTTT